jgi:hypothetical protein
MGEAGGRWPIRPAGGGRQSPRRAAGIQGRNAAPGGWSNSSAEPTPTGPTGALKNHRKRMPAARRAQMSGAWFAAGIPTALTRFRLCPISG